MPGSSLEQNRKSQAPGPAQKVEAGIQSERCNPEGPWGSLLPALLERVGVSKGGVWWVRLNPPPSPQRSPGLTGQAQPPAVGGDAAEKHRNPHRGPPGVQLQNPRPRHHASSPGKPRADVRAHPAPGPGEKLLNPSNQLPHPGLGPDRRQSVMGGPQGQGAGGLGWG